MKNLKYLFSFSHKLSFFRGFNPQSHFNMTSFATQNYENYECGTVLQLSFKFHSHLLISSNQSQAL